MKRLLLTLVLGLWTLDGISAITVAQLTAGASTTNATSYTTSSITVHANRLVILGYQNARDAGSSGVPTPSMSGVTWTSFPTNDHISYHTTGSPTRRVSAWSAYPSSDQTGTITISHAGVTQDGAAWSVVEFTGTSGVIVQANAASGGSGAVQVTCTLSAFADAVNNVAYGVFGTSQAAGISPGSGFTEIDDQTYSTPSNELQTEWRIGQDLSVDATFAAADCGCLAAEIAVAGSMISTKFAVLGDDE